MIEPENTTTCAQTAEASVKDNTAPAEATVASVQAPISHTRTPDMRELTGAALAYLGDASLELIVRRYLLGLKLTGSGRLNSLALNFVKATAQSEAIDRLLPYLTEEEEYVYRRGRNANGISAPKSASVREYRRATGFEALFGYLELAGKHERADELFHIAYAPVTAKLESELCVK